MAFPILKSEDGRVQRVVTSQDELEAYEKQGYTRVRAAKAPEAEKAPEKPVQKPAS